MMGPMIRKALKRLRGFSFFGVGATFAPATDEREVILRLFAQLADRRVLFHHSCRVPHQEMIASLEKMRTSITTALEQIPESPAASNLIQMSRACHNLQSVVEAYFRSETYEPLQADFHVSLSELRQMFALSAARLSSMYKVSFAKDFVQIANGDDTDGKA